MTREDAAERAAKFLTDLVGWVRQDGNLYFVFDEELLREMVEMATALKTSTPSA